MIDKRVSWIERLQNGSINPSRRGDTARLLLLIAARASFSPRPCRLLFLVRPAFKFSLTDMHPTDHEVYSVQVLRNSYHKSPSSSASTINAYSSLGGIIFVCYLTTDYPCIWRLWGGYGWFQMVRRPSICIFRHQDEVEAQRYDPKPFQAADLCSGYKL